MRPELGQDYATRVLSSCLSQAARLWLRPFPGARLGHRLLGPDLFHWKPHLRGTSAEPPLSSQPSLSPHLWFPLPPLSKTLLTGLQMSRAGRGPVWLRCGPLFAGAPAPVWASRRWDGGSNTRRSGETHQEGRVQSRLSGKFISHHILQLFTSLTGFGHPDMKRGSPLTNIIEEGPK